MFLLSRGTLAVVVTAVVGLLGSAVAGRQWLFAVPSVSLSGPGRIDVLSGETPTLELTVLNYGGTRARVRLSSVNAADSIMPDELDLEPTERALVGVRASTAAPGAQDLSFAATVSAGALRGTATVLHRVLRRDWPLSAGSPVTVLAVDSPRSARFQVEISTGVAYPAGLRCLAVAKLPASATFAGVSPAEAVEQPRRNAEHANETMSLMWLTAPAARFRSVAYTFDLTTTDDWDTPRWDALASRTSVTCEGR